MLAVVAHYRTGLPDRIMVTHRVRPAPHARKRVWMSRRMREALKIRRRYPARYAMSAVAFVAVVVGMLAAMRPSPQELNTDVCTKAPYVGPLFDNGLDLEAPGGNDFGGMPHRSRPSWGERFESILPPAPAFALRKRAMGAIPLAQDTRGQHHRTQAQVPHRNGSPASSASTVRAIDWQIGGANTINALLELPSVGRW